MNHSIHIRLREMLMPLADKMQMINAVSQNGGMSSEVMMHWDKSAQKCGNLILINK